MTIVLAAALLAFSQGDAERLRRLEDQVKKQQAEIDELKNQRASESEWSATFTEGLHWRTKDGEFDIHVGGRFEEQYRHVFSRPDASRTQPDSFYVREAFLSADGSLARDFFFRINGDFTSSIAGPGANLEEAYLEWKGLPEFQLRFGQFRTPNSQETLTSTLFTDCIERSMLSRFVPEVEPGIQAAGEIERGLVTYQIAVINGRAEPSSSGRSTNDNNDEKDLLARITVSPFESDYFRYLRLGVYGSIGDASDVPMDSQFDLTTTELGVTYFDSTAGFLDGRRWRAGAELSWAFGPASIRAEVLRRTDRIRNAADTLEERLPVRAWYVQGTCVLHGAEKVVESRLTPSEPFDPAQGHWGAVEIVLRAAGATVGAHPLVEVGNTLAGQSNRLIAYTAGLNWYPVKNVRLSANWIFEDYRRDVDFGTGVVAEHLQGLLFRFQLDF